jgi:hypothetical protein
MGTQGGSHGRSLERVHRCYQGLCHELDEAKSYCNEEDQASIEAKIRGLAKLWDQLSNAIEL